MSTRVARLSEWFVLQLDFAEALATRSDIPLGTAITFYTNLCRRFGFSRPVRHAPCKAPWDSFVKKMVTRTSRSERIALTLAFASAREPCWQSTAGTFGCFSFDPPKDGAVRIHFAPNDNTGGTGPLSRQKYAKRIAELATMFACLRRDHPEAREVVGGSWLYNIDAYRRLFPPEYLASLTVHTTPKDLTGGSWWGQFIDHAENVNAERVAECRRRLTTLDPHELWKVFPFPAMAARADVRAFYDHYADDAAGANRWRMPR